MTRDLSPLAQRGYSYEVVEEGARVYIIFKDYPLPKGLYCIGVSLAEKTRLLIFTTQFYPNAGFDMFWVDDALTLKSGGNPRSADQIEVHLGQKWRRFSYHPYNAKAWNPAEDSVAQFLAHVDKRLKNGD